MIFGRFLGALCDFWMVLGYFGSLFECLLDDFGMVLWFWVRILSDFWVIFGWFWMIPQQPERLGVLPIKLRGGLGHPPETLHQVPEVPPRGSVVKS